MTDMTASLLTATAIVDARATDVLPNRFDGGDVTGPNGTARICAGDAIVTVYRFTTSMTMVWSATFDTSAPSPIVTAAFAQAVSEVR